MCLAEKMLVLSSAISLERLSRRHATHEGMEGPEFSSGLRNARKRDPRTSENDDVDDYQRALAILGDVPMGKGSDVLSVRFAASCEGRLWG